MANLFDINATDNVIGKFVVYTTGVLSGNANYNATGFISVNPETSYSLSYKHQIAWYNSSKAYISGSNSSDTNKIQTSPVGAAFVRCTVLVSVWQNFQFKEYIVSNTLAGKKWCSYGNSITAMDLYQPIVSAKYQLISYPRGVGGTGVIDFGETSMSNDVRIATIPADTDILTIFGGVNDSNYTLGTINDTDATTFYGAYKIMLEKIYVRIPNAEIILVTPTYHQGETVLENFRQAVREVGAMYKYPVIDMNNCGINKLNASKMLTDGTHPTTLGAERIARQFIFHFLNIY